MDIIIMGGGKVGEMLCKKLSPMENCNITLIEKNEAVLNRLLSKFDISGVCGSGIDVKTINEAPIAKADLFVAVSEKDDTNIISCVMAKQLGANQTIARVRGWEYSGNLEFLKNAMGISRVINPDKEAAYSIYRTVKYPYAVSIETFIGSNVSIIGVYIDKESIVKGIALKEFRKKFNVIVCVIQRDTEVLIPNGDSRIFEGDIIYVTGQPQDMQEFYQEVGFLNEKPLKKAMIVGGGKISYYLLPLLARLKMQITIIENDYDMAKKLSSIYDDISVMNGDGTDQDYLDELGIDSYDTFISLTGVDEENALASLFANERGVKKIITKINRTVITRLFDREKIKSIISPKRVIADEIIRMARSQLSAAGSNLQGLYTIADEQVEALQFLITEKSKVLGISLLDMNIKENTIIAYIIRDGKLFFPTGTDCIKDADTVLIVTKNTEIIDIDDILV